MCTVINISGNKHFFGRTLDMAASLGESIVLVPRNYPLAFRFEGRRNRHFAFVGTAHLIDGEPLFYDTVNEFGLCCAALRFAEACAYSDKPTGEVNLCSFEFIPYVMANFRSVSEAKEGLGRLCISAEGFSKEVAPSPLHYIISDKEGSVVIESTVGGVSLYESALGVLTNAPEYPIMLAAYESGASFDPLDLGSRARFCKGARLSKKCTPTTCIEMSTVMGAVSVARGSGNGSDSEAHRTVYISSIDSTRREYTLLHESCHAVRTVSLMRENLDRSSLKIYDVSAPQSDIFNPSSFEC